MGSRLGPNYACLLVGYVEERMLSSYTLLDVVKSTSVSSSSLPPRFTVTLNIHDLSQRTNFLSWISA